MPTDLILKHWIDTPNAGDAFSRLVAEKYIGPVSAVAEATPVEQTNVLLIGSLMSWADRHSIICGTGMISPLQVPKQTPLEVVSVRGPLTRYFLTQHGVAVPDRFGDAGLLAADFLANPPKAKYRCGVILHHAEKWLWPKVFYKKFFRRQEILFIDIALDPINVFEKISQCELIYSSSLHGIIFAHALQRRAAWIELSDRVGGNGFKFYDYYLSVGVPPESVPRIKLHGVEDLARYEHLAQCPAVDRVAANVREALGMVRERLSVGAQTSRPPQLSQRAS